jgi:hypothetical protein
MGSSGPRRRKPRAPLPRVPDYVRYPKAGGRYWRLGGPLTKEHEAEALAAQRAREPGRVARWVLRRLGYRPERP